MTPIILYSLQLLLLDQTNKVKSVEFNLSDKQLFAYDVLTLPEYADISELVFGGGARGGKTFLGSFWTSTRACSFPGSGWLIAREELKALKRTTLRTFFTVLSRLGLRRGIHFEFNAQDMVLTFANGSVVFFSELKRQPSDPEFDRLGSYDLTGAWIDESQEVCKDAKDALQFRFTVLAGNSWSTNPKTLYTCNPGKGWIYSDFWKPLIKKGEKVEGKMFITSLFSDNPHIDQGKYKKNVLRTKNKVKIERLLRGNFEYDDDPRRIFEYDKILDLFTNKAKNKEGKFIVCDVARTIDRIPVGYFEGMQLKELHVFRNKPIPDTAKFINELAAKKGVPHSNIAIDADGLGIGVVDSVPNCKAFHNGASPFHPRKAKKDDSLKLNYANLKTQCYFLLADYVNDGKIGIDEISEKDKADLIEELDVVKQVSVDSDKKIEIEKKEIVKELLGRSPDLADVMMMRMYFEVKPEKTFFFSNV